MPDFKVIDIDKEVPNGANVIERLEEALEKAKHGGVDNCLIVMSFNNGDIMDCWANGNKPFVIVGALESLKKDFMDACIEDRKNET